MQNAAGGDASARFDDPEAIYGSIAANLISMVERLQASMKLIASAIAQHGTDRAAAGHRRPARLADRA
jgi:hypothetical protein